LKHLYRLARFEKEHVRFAKFCIVGASGIGVNEGGLWILTDFGGVHYLISGLISVEASIITNFLLNDFWTFKDRRNASMLRRGMKFNLARLSGLLLNLALLWLFTSILGIFYLTSNLLAIALVMLWNYAWSRHWVLKQ